MKMRLSGWKQKRKNKGRLIYTKIDKSRRFADKDLFVNILLFYLFLFLKKDVDKSTSWWYYTKRLAGWEVRT